MQSQLEHDLLSYLQLHGWLQQTENKLKLLVTDSVSPELNAFTATYLLTGNQMHLCVALLNAYLTPKTRKVIEFVLFGCFRRP